MVFTINDSLPSASFEVRAAAFEEVGLDLSSPSGEDAPSDVADDAAADDTAADAAADDTADNTDDAPAADDTADDTDDAPAADAESLGMPVTGSGGLAGGGSRLPVLSLIFAISALVGMGGVMAVRRMRA